MPNEQFFFTKLIAIIYETTGLDCSEYNEDYIKRRVNARILANTLLHDDYFAYIRLLEKNLDEIRYLFNALTINVTRFFRDPELWNLLKTDVFPKLAAEKKEEKHRTLNLWSCGCSSGEEPYSIAILLNELLQNSGLTSTITATDIDEISLDSAKKGLYSPYALSDTPNEYLLKYFRHSAPDMSLIDESIKPQVKLMRHNFLNDTPPGRDYDIIFCRNVIIYFKNTAKEKVIELFHKTLVPHGWLVIGKSEILHEKHLKGKFYIYQDTERVFRKERRLNDRRGEVKNERRKNWWFGYENIK